MTHRKQKYMVFAQEYEGIGLIFFENSLFCFYSLLFCVADSGQESQVRAAFGCHKEAERSVIVLFQISLLLEMLREQ